MRWNPEPPPPSNSPLSKKNKASGSLRNVQRGLRESQALPVIRRPLGVTRRLRSFSPLLLSSPWGCGCYPLLPPLLYPLLPLSPPLSSGAPGTPTDPLWPPLREGSPQIWVFRPREHFLQIFRRFLCLQTKHLLCLQTRPLLCQQGNCCVIVSAKISQDIPPNISTTGWVLRGMSWEMSADTMTQQMSCLLTQQMSCQQTTAVLSAETRHPQIPRGRRLPSTAVTIKWEQKCPSRVLPQTIPRNWDGAAS